MTNKTQAEKIVYRLKKDDKINIKGISFYSNKKSSKFRILDKGGSFQFRVDGKGDKITLYDQINKSYEYNDINLVLDKIKQIISERNPVRDKKGEIIQDEGTGKKEALGKTAVGCLQLLPVVVALGLLIAIARACG